MKIINVIKQHRGFTLIVFLSSILWLSSLGLFLNRNINSHDSLIDLEVTRVEAYYQNQIYNIIQDVTMLEIYAESVGDSISQDEFTNFVETQGLENDIYDNFTIAIFSDDYMSLTHEYIYPYDPESIVLGYDLLTDDRDEVIDSINAALISRLIEFSGPYELRQGEEGIVFRKTIYFDGEIFGMVNVVANYDKINELLELDNSKIVNTSVFDKNNEIVFGDLEFYENLYHYKDIDIDNIKWSIGIDIIPEFSNRYLLNSALILSVSTMLYFLALFVGVSFYKKTQRLIIEQESLIFFDKLTKLPTRRRLNDDIESGIIDKTSFFLGFGDLDNFKNLNDVLGHTIGDVYLADVGSRFNSVTNDKLKVYRWGGDEFIFIIKEESKEKAITLLEDIYRTLINPIVLNDLDYNISMSMGLVNYPKDGCTLDDLIKKADIVMYDVKNRQKNQYAFFEDKYLDKLLREVNFEKKLNDYELDDFKVYLQPVVSVKNNEIMGFEALTRLFDENNKIINTGELIKYYERNGKIQALDYKIFDQVCKFKIETDKISDEKFFYSFNMSPLSLSLDTIKYFEKTIKKYKLDPADFVIEIIETIGFKDIDESIVLLSKLREIGFKIAMDDFGIGYSSLSYITKLPLSIIKIDKSFVDNYAENEFDRLLIYTINDISRSLNLEIIVEGIETVQQLNFIKEINCHYYQGYLHSKPMKFEDIIKLINSKVIE